MIWYKKRPLYSTKRTAGLRPPEAEGGGRAGAAPRLPGGAPWPWVPLGPPRLPLQSPGFNLTDVIGVYLREESVGGRFGAGGEAPCLGVLPAPSPPGSPLHQSGRSPHHPKGLSPLFPQGGWGEGCGPAPDLRKASSGPTVGEGGGGGEGAIAANRGKEQGRKGGSATAAWWSEGGRCSRALLP